LSKPTSYALLAQLKLNGKRASRRGEARVWDSNQKVAERNYGTCLYKEAASLKNKGRRTALRGSLRHRHEEPSRRAICG
jgi:hypothetical protein